MSQFRKVEIAKMLEEWMDRFSVPMHLRDKPKAAQEEAEALLRCLLKMAPHSDYQPFVREVFDRLEGMLKGRVWPTVYEIGAACSNLRKERPSVAGSAPVVDLSPEGINSRRMQRGEPVGEGWLYGSLAVDLIAKGLIEEDTMRRYRSGAFLARKAVYGEDAALKWEAEAKERHDAARAVYRHRREEPQRRDTSVPDKAAPYSAAAFAAE